MRKVEKFISDNEFLTVKDLLKQCSKEYKNKTVFSYKDIYKKQINVSYKETEKIVATIGNKMLSNNIIKSHCALIGELSFQWIMIYLSIISSGNIVVPIDHNLNITEILNLINTSKCKYVFISQKAYNKIISNNISNNLSFIIFNNLENEYNTSHIYELIMSGYDTKLYNAVDINTSDLCEIVYTSGTTGISKGVMLSQKNIIVNAIEANKLVDFTDRTMCFLPPHHTLCTTINILAHYIRGSYIYLSSGLKYLEKEYKEVSPKHLLMVPLFLEEIYKKMINNLKSYNNYDDYIKKIEYVKTNHLSLIDKRKLFPFINDYFGSNIQYIISGGAPLSQEIINNYFYMGLPIINGYGITECSPLISCNLVDNPIENSVGKPIDCIDITINPINNSKYGEIWVKGPCNFIGYFNDEVTYKKVMNNGYFNTGDIGYIKNNNLFIVGRIKNMIVLSNGENIYPEELENLISKIDEVKEVIVTEKLNNNSGNTSILEAIIFLDPNNDFEKNKSLVIQKIQNINDTLVFYKRISSIKFLDKPLKRTSSHKIIRNHQ